MEGALAISPWELLPYFAEGGDEFFWVDRQCSLHGFDLLSLAGQECTRPPRRLTFNRLSDAGEVCHGDDVGHSNVQSGGGKRPTNVVEGGKGGTRNWRTVAAGCLCGPHVLVLQLRAEAAR